MTVSHHYSRTVSAADHLLAQSPEELAKEADELLRQSKERMGQGDYPFYTEAWIRHLSQADADLPLPEDRGGLGLRSFKEACLRLVAQTPMRRRYRQALRLRMKDLTFQEIGEQMGVSLSQARRWVNRATGLLAAAVVDPDGLLNQHEAIQAAYYQDTHRYGYRGERHCKPGHEACQKTGICIRRWYLMYQSD